jgi:hypothetical protein
MPYKKALISPEAKELMLAEREISEQPDGDFSVY